MRTKFVLLVIVLIAFSFAAGHLSAGSPDPPAGPTSSASQMHTIEQIYQRISNGGEFGHPHMSTFTEPTVPPGTSSGHTLSDVYFLLGRSAHVRRSGQTLCYSLGGGVISCPNTGEDGEFRRGVLWPSPRFTNNNNGSVTDNLSGLIWLRNANCAGGTTDWGTALTFIVTLNASGTMSGTNCLDTSNNGTHQTDWRLPNVEELQSLIDYGFALPAVSNAAGTGKWTQGDPFLNLQGTSDGAGRYWSSTTFDKTPTAAWEVDLSVGTVNRNQPKTLATLMYVWAVRNQ